MKTQIVIAALLGMTSVFAADGVVAHEFYNPVGYGLKHEFYNSTRTAEDGSEIVYSRLATCSYSQSGSWP